MTNQCNVISCIDAGYNEIWISNQKTGKRSSFYFCDLHKEQFYKILNFVILTASSSD